MLKTADFPHPCEVGIESISPKLESSDFSGCLKELKFAFCVAGIPCSSLICKVMSCFPPKPLISGQDVLSKYNISQNDYLEMLRDAAILMLFTSPQHLRSLNKDGKQALATLINLVAYEASQSENCILRQTIAKGALYLAKNSNRGATAKIVFNASLVFRIIFQSPNINVLLSEPNLVTSLLQFIDILENNESISNAYIRRLLKRVGVFAGLHSSFLSIFLTELKTCSSLKKNQSALIWLLSNSYEALCSKMLQLQANDTTAIHDLRSTVLISLAEAWNLTFELRLPVDIQQAFDPWLRCLSIEDINGKHIGFQASITKLLRRIPVYSLPLFTRAITKLRVNLSESVLQIIETSGLMDLLKDEKATMRELALKFLESLILHIQKPDDVEKCLNLFSKPLDRNELVKLYGKLSFIEAIQTISLTSAIPLSNLTQILEKILHPHGYFLSKGLTNAELSEPIRVACINLTGRYLQTCDTTTTTLHAVLSCLAAVLNDVKCSEKIKFAAIEALSLGLEANLEKPSMVSNVDFSGFLTKSLNTLVSLASIALTKPSMRLLSLQALLVLLRLEILYPHATHNTDTASFQKIFKDNDSFLNNLVIIGKAPLNETVVHCQIVKTILSITKTHSTVLGVSFYDILPSMTDFLQDFSHLENSCLKFPPDEGCIPLIGFYRGCIGLFIMLFHSNTLSPPVQNLYGKSTTFIKTVSYDDNITLRYDFLHTFRQTIATPLSFSQLALALYQLLSEQYHLKLSLQQQYRKDWNILTTSTSPETFLFSTEVPSSLAFQNCIELLLDILPKEINSSEKIMTILCLTACHPLASFIRHNQLQPANISRFWSHLMVRKSKSEVNKNVVTSLYPDVREIPIFLSCLLSEKYWKTSTQTDDTGYRIAFVHLLTLLSPQLSFKLDQVGQVVTESFSHNAIVEASNKVLQTLLTYLKAVGLPQLSTPDVQLYFAPEGRLYIEEGVYIAQEVENKNIKIDKTQRELYGDAAEEVIKATAKASLKRGKPNEKTSKQTPKKEGNKTRAELEQEQIVAQSVQRQSIRMELAQLEFLYDCLLGLSFSNHGAVEHVCPDLVPLLLKLFKCPISATQTLQLLRNIVSHTVSSTVFPSPSVIPDALFHTALKRPEIEPAMLESLQEVSQSNALSSAAASFILPVVEYCLKDKEHIMGTKAIIAGLEFLVRQLRQHDATLDLATSISCLNAVLMCHPGRAGSASEALTSICRNPKFSEDLVDDVIQIGMHNDSSVRYIVIIALNNANCRLDKAAAFLLVERMDKENPQIAKHAEDLFNMAFLCITHETVKNYLFYYIANENAVFRSLASKALAEAVNELNTSTQINVPSIYERLFCEYEDTTSLSHRLGIAEACSELSCRRLVISKEMIEAIFSFLITKALNDPNLSAVSDTASLLAALETFGLETIRHCSPELHPTLLPIFEKLADGDNRKEGYRAGAVDAASALFLGAIAHFMSPDDPATKKILDQLLLRISDSANPTRAVQRKIADVLSPLVKTCSTSGQIDGVSLIEELLEHSLKNESYVSRNGYALALAAAVKGLGISALRQNDILKKLLEASDNKDDAVRRQGAILCFQSLSEILGRSFEPYVVQVLGTLMTAFSDTAQPVRFAAQAAAKAIMSSLSAHGIKLILPILTTKAADKQWRTRLGSIEALGAMAYCAPRQLASLLPQVVPQLCEMASDAHPEVKSASHDALKAVASVISNQEIRDLSPVLLNALAKPNNTTACAALDVLLNTEFVNAVDSASLALICPIVVRALRERSSETKKKAAAIVASMVHLSKNPSDFLPYFPQIRPQLQETLLDPIPDVRTVAARAFGTIVKGLGEENLEDLLAWLLDKLKSRDSSVERSGAANGLAQVLAALGPAKLAELLPNILQNAESPQADVREGYLGLFVFLPSAFGADFQQFVPQVLPVLLRGLSWEAESLREVAFRASEVLVMQYGATHTVLLLGPLEDGVFNPNWRIRHSTVSLLGTLIDRLLRFTPSTGGQLIVSEVLSVERRAFILSSLYIVRSDENPIVRQQATLAWKSVVQNTPKTLKEILPILMRRLCANLDSTVPHKQITAARCIGDLATKLPDEVIPELMPRFISMLSSTSASSSKHGACIGISAVVAHAPKNLFVSYSKTLLPAIQHALCDVDPTVRGAATQCLGKFLEGFGTEGLPGVIEEILISICTPPTFNPEDFEGTSRAAQLTGVQVLLETQHQLLIPSVLAACKGPLFDLSRIRLMACIASIQQIHAFNYCLSRIMPNLIDAGVFGLTRLFKLDQGGGSNDKEDTLINTLENFDPNIILSEVRQSVERLIRRCSVDDTISRNLLIDFIEKLKSVNAAGDFTTMGHHKILSRLIELSLVPPSTKTITFDDVTAKYLNSIETETSNPYCRAIIFDFIGLFIRCSTVDMKQHLGILLRTLIPAALADPAPFVREYSMQAIGSLTNLTKKFDGSTGSAVIELEQIIRKLFIDPVSGKEDKEFIFVGLTIKGSLDYFYTMYHTGLMIGTPEVRETAAIGLGELFTHCPIDALKPVAVKITGPLIRAAAEKVPPAVKCAILHTLRILLIKAGAFLKPLLPQIQISFVKAVPDQSAAVRRAGTSGLGCLAELAATRTEALITELCSYLGTQQDPVIRTAILQALRDVLSKLGSPCSDISHAKITATTKPLIYNRSTPDILKTIASECQAILLVRHTSKAKLITLFKEDFELSMESQDLETRQSTAMLLCDLTNCSDFWNMNKEEDQLSSLAKHDDDEKNLQNCSDDFLQLLNKLLLLGLQDDRTNVRRWAVLAFSNAMRFARKSSMALSLVFAILHEAVVAINSFGSSSGIQVMYVTLRGLKSLMKYVIQSDNVLTINQRCNLLLPALNGLTLPHPGVKLMAERILFYGLEVHLDNDSTILHDIQIAQILDANRFQLLSEYDRRVLSKIPKTLSDSENDD